MFLKFICFLLRALLSLRYKVKIIGLKTLTPETLSRKGGILFLPNHTALIEPLLLFLILLPRYKMRPLVVDYVYHTPFLAFLMNLINAIQIPDFRSSVNQLKISRGEKAMDQIKHDLKNGRNFLIYPSGGLKRTPHEILGGVSGVHDIVQKCPDANPVLIRTTGFWGSSFSPAIKGRTRGIGEIIFKGIKTILKNGIFFAPRRKITIEFELAPTTFPRNASRLEFNRYLEDWYNRYPDGNGGRVKEEPLLLVSYSVFRKELAVPFNFAKEKKISEISSINAKTKCDIYAEVRRIIDNSQIELCDDMKLSDDLGMDSLNIGDLMAFLSSKYDVTDVHPEDLDTVLSVLEIAEGARVISKQSLQGRPVGWPLELKRPEIALPVESTLPEAFLRSCNRMGAAAACGDELVGVVSFKKMKKTALVLAQYFRTLKGDRIAVLLPASYGAYLTIIALQLAGKVPVMLNWTLGRYYLEEMMKVSGAESVISSGRFLDKLTHVEFGDLTDKILLLEDIRTSLSWKMKLKGLCLSFCTTTFIQRFMGIQNTDEDSPAVILFTSGTESTPKGVPLSHKNILSNLSSVMERLGIKSTDVLYGILPPFHSFGFTCAGLYPFLVGGRVAFYPNPTDSFAIAEGIARWKISIFCSVPTFLRGLLGAASKEQLKSIRYFIMGAEKIPSELVERVSELQSGAKIIEGYGITECSPVVATTRSDLTAMTGVHLISGMEICMVHPETKELLPHGVEGEICVRGPSVFSGYLGETSSPFISINRQSWYRTGDIGHFSLEGSLILTGRLKRFTKVGGEMISLAVVEEFLCSSLVKEGKIKIEIPSIAVCADERIAGKAGLILFSIIDIERDEANGLLIKAGFSRLIKIGAVQKVLEIPIMGSGKINHRQLQATYLT